MTRRSQLKEITLASNELSGLKGQGKRLTKVDFKGTVSREIVSSFCSSQHVPQPTDSYPKAFSNVNLNSPRYSYSKPIPWCGPLPSPQDRQFSSS